MNPDKKDTYENNPEPTQEKPAENYSVGFSGEDPSDDTKMTHTFDTSNKELASPADSSTPPTTQEPTPDSNSSPIYPASPERISHIAQIPLADIPDPGAQANSSAGVLVLQWLTYAFWGWTVLALSFMTGSVITFFVDKTDMGDFLIYNIAAMLVLLPISFVCDAIYSKKEPVKKAGPAVAIMVIHAVLFAILAIGALITAVFSLVSLLISSGDSKVQIIAISSGLIIFLYYILTFLRALSPASILKFRKFYRYIMLVTVGVIIVLSIVGPVMYQRTLVNDRLIDKGINELETSIKTYTTKNNELPGSLSDLSLGADSKKIVDLRLVEYKKKDKSSNSSRYGEYGDVYFDLCVTYKAESKGFYESTDNPNTSYNHPAGYQCFEYSAFLPYDYDNKNIDIYGGQLNTTTPELEAQ